MEQLDEREKYWIAYYNTYKGEGYNCNEGGGKSNGENNGRAKLTANDVAYIRECYDAHMRRKDVYELFKDITTFGNFANIWDGSSWPDIKPEVYTIENLNYYKYHATDGGDSSKAIFTDEEVMYYRKRYVNETARDIYKDVKDRIKYRSLQQILCGRCYKNLPIYKKKEKKWINVEACNDYPL